MIDPFEDEDLGEIAKVVQNIVVTGGGDAVEVLRANGFLEWDPAGSGDDWTAAAYWAAVVYAIAAGRPAILQTESWLLAEPLIRLAGPGAPGDEGAQSPAELAGELAVVGALVGAIRTSSERALAYTSTREQFGQPLAAKQVVQHKLATMAVLSDMAALAFRGAVSRSGAPLGEIRTAVSVAKEIAVGYAAAVTAEAIQVHGAMGFTAEVGLGEFFDLAKDSSATGRRAAWHRRQLGERLLRGEAQGAMT